MFVVNRLAFSCTGIVSPFDLTHEEKQRHRSGSSKTSASSCVLGWGLHPAGGEQCSGLGGERTDESVGEALITRPNQGVIFQSEVPDGRVWERMMDLCAQRASWYEQQRFCNDSFTSCGCPLIGVWSRGISGNSASLRPNGGGMRLGYPLKLFVRVCFGVAIPLHPSKIQVPTCRKEIRFGSAVSNGTLRSERTTQKRV